MNRPQVTRILVAVVVTAIVGSLVAYWLTRRSPSDREQILDAFLAAEQAIERKSVSGLLRHVAADYDDGSYIKGELTPLVLAAFRDSGAVDVLAHVRSLEIRGEQASAKVEVELSVASYAEGKRVPLVLQVQLKKARGTWQVTSAQGWEPAQEAF